MRAISRYVFIQLIAVTLVVTVALTCGVWLIRSLRLLDHVVNRGLPVDTFLWKVVLLPTFLSVVLPIGYSIIFYFQPVSHKAFSDYQFEAQNDLTGVLLQEGAFSDPAQGITVYVRERSADGKLRGLLIHDNRDPGNPVTVMAESGALVANGGNPRVVMSNGNQQQIDKDSGVLLGIALLFHLEDG
jgi:lipopolysaccharide export system permease protein